MDFSGLDKNHKCYDATNTKVLGKLKGWMRRKNNDWIYRTAP